MYFTKKDRRNHLLIKYLSGKRQESLIFFTSTFNFYIFFSRYLSISPIKFSERPISFIFKLLPKNFN